MEKKVLLLFYTEKEANIKWNTTVHSSIIHNDQKVEATQVFMDRGMEQQNVANKSINQP